MIIVDSDIFLFNWQIDANSKKKCRAIANYCTHGQTISITSSFDVFKCVLVPDIVIGKLSWPQHSPNIVPSHAAVGGGVQPV